MLLVRWYLINSNIYKALNTLHFPNLCKFVQISFFSSTHVRLLLLFLSWSRFWLFCATVDCSLPGSSVHGISQTWILEWVAISFSRVSSWPRDWTQVSHVVDRCFTIWATRVCTHTLLVAQSCPTLCNPMDCSPPGSTVHGILQARILGWVAIWSQNVWV